VAVESGSETIVFRCVSVILERTACYMCTLQFLVPQGYIVSQ